MSRRHSFLVLLLPIMVLVFPGLLRSEVLTLSDGSVQSLTNLSFGTDGVKGQAGSQTVTIPRGQIRDISLSGQTRESDVLGTESADLLPLLGQARETLRRYPDSRSITVVDEGECTHRKDGTSLTRTRSTVFLAKEEALGAAEVGLSFDPNREKVRILYARCLAPDGTVHSLAPDQIKVSKGSSGGEYFNNQQEISFTIPNATVGCLIDYSYEVDEFNPFDKNLFQSFFLFQSFEPVKSSVLIVKTPKDEPLYFLSRNCPPALGSPTLGLDGEYQTYTWKFTDQPPIIAEPSMPPLRDIAPGVAYCLQKDWTYMFNRLKPMFEKRFQVTEPVKKKVDELIAGATTMEEKMSRLYRFCQKEIRYISIKGNLASNQVGHPAEDTLKNRYGDCTDKGMLLATMLKHIGVEAYPVGILTNQAGKAIRELPLFDSNHCITEVHWQGKRFYLDSTATDYRFPYFRADDHQTLAENAMTGAINPVPLPPPEDNALKVTRELTLLPDGTTKVTFDSEANGAGESSYRHSGRSLKPEEYEKSVRAMIAGLTSDYILEIATHSDPLDFSGPFRNSSRYTLNHFASRSGKYLVFEIPLYRISFPEVSLEKRNFAIVYTTTSQRTDDILIHLPDGFTARYLPPALTIKTPYVEFEGNYVLEGHQVRATRRLSILQRTIPVADYAAHREALERIAKFSEERLFLEETGGQGGQP